MTFRLLVFILISLFSAVGIHFHAQTVYTDSMVVLNMVDGIVDEAGVYDLESVQGDYLNQPDSALKIKCITDFTEIQPSPTVYWVKYQVTNGSNDSTVVLDFKNWTDVSVFEGGRLIGKTGHFLPFHQRSLPLGNDCFVRLPMSIGSTKEFIVKMSCSSDFLVMPTTIDISASTEDLIIEKEAKETQYINFFLGIYFFIILYNFFVMLVTRSKAYMLYVVLIAINFFALAHNFGYTIELFSGWSSYPQWHAQIDNVFSTLFGLSIMAFTAEFLRIRKHFKLVYKIFCVLAILLVLVLVPTFIGQSFLTYNLSSLLGLILFGVVLTVSIKAYRKGLPSSNYFLLAFGFFIVGMVVYLLKEVGVVPDLTLTKYSMQIGTTFEAMLFAIALGDRINKLQLQNKQQQTQIIQQLKANEILQLKANLELEQKVKERTHEIQIKNAELELSNKHITDSLNYAKNIQSSILSSHNALDANLIPNFVFFQPKELVSGDFYWSYQVNATTIIWITADCTGHGVPGALMSIIGHVLLNKIVIEKGITKVDLILGQLRQGIIDTMTNENTDRTRRDGIDMSVCKLDTRTKRLNFAGANSRMWVVNTGEIKEFKGDAQPVGHHLAELKPYTEHEIVLQDKETVYTFTDGFPDQFGGAEEKKYGYRRFRSLVAGISEKPIEQQADLFKKELVQWEAAIGQIDDITIIGVRP